VNRPIYLDTNLWNALLDQSIAIEPLMSNLTQQGATLALSNHTLYELSKTFAGNPTRARALCECAQHALDSGAIAVYDAMDQLHLEVESAKTGTPIVWMRAGHELDLFKGEVAELASGTVGSALQTQIAQWDQFAKQARAGQNAHFECKAETKSRINTVSEPDLRAWLDAEMLSSTGTALLIRQLTRLYSGTLDTATAVRLAAPLLANSAFRIARADVCATLYSNWRSATRDSIRKDLVPDLYHVLNASYCSVYATEEAGQIEYAALLLPDTTQVAIYDGATPVDHWLASFAT
jgi:hypothetical protein